MDYDEQQSELSLELKGSSHKDSHLIPYICSQPEGFIMICATLKDAKATLNKLVEYATAGEDVILMKGSRHVAAIVPISEADLRLSSRLSDAKAAALWERIDEEIADGRAKEWKGTGKERA